MSAWWNSLTLLQRILACIAVPATLVLILQTLLSLIGLTGENDIDHDTDHDFDNDHETDHENDHEQMDDHEHGGLGLHLLTFRGVIAFLAVYGWGSLAISRAGHPWLAAIIFGLIMGLAAMLLVAVVMKLFISLQSNGNIEFEKRQ
jgi:ABC-type nickel/cobalt efflux system permease component RcnA